MSLKINIFKDSMSMIKRYMEIAIKMPVEIAADGSTRLMDEYMRVEYTKCDGLPEKCENDVNKHKAMYSLFVNSIKKEFQDDVLDEDQDDVLDEDQDEDQDDVLDEDQDDVLDEDQDLDQDEDEDLDLDQDLEQDEDQDEDQGLDFTQCATDVIKILVDPKEMKHNSTKKRKNTSFKMYRSHSAKYTQRNHR